jgi:[ribosomal protein S18]-alanine N-acetyltransferase
VSFLIRAMEGADIDRVLLLATETSDAPRWARGDYEHMLLEAPAPLLMRHALVAQYGGSLAGFAVASWLRRETAAELEGLFVDRGFRRKGIGGSLMRACMTWAANCGASAVRLEVRASNDAALALYRQHGFCDVGVRPAYYSAPKEDALLLEATLPL